MGAQARFAHARIGASKQTRAPLERGIECDPLPLKERSLVGVSKIATPSADSQHFWELEETVLGTPVKMAAPVCNIENEVVVISDDEDEVQPDSGEGPSGCDTSHVSSGHGLQVSHQRSGQMVGEQSMPVRVRVSSEHRPEGRVKPGVVYPTSGETAGIDDAQPSNSQGAGAGWASLEEELLDYEDDLEEPVMSRQRVVLTGDVPGLVQGGHSKAHCRDVSAGNLPRGEDGFVGSGRVHELRENLGGLSRTRALKAMGGSREQSLGKVDASIQVSSVTEVDGKLEVTGDNGDGSVKKAESGVVRRSGGLDLISKRQDDAVCVFMQQIEAGLAVVTISGCVGGPDKVCAVWIVGHSFARWAEKQASSQHFGRQLGLDGTRIKISWVGKSGMRWGVRQQSGMEPIASKECRERALFHYAVFIHAFAGQ
ncbi:hypothetical protein NDU88_006105 [Pleurodeles waltl]|uniref:Uncharacterized protein n=1 Tax=Pleurodeles waltl TaxID=8319 RepID=A0AAV7QN10_PLEWA|nr:hypothetical protein NDU88_006105 [Pleurodeles waltl]